MRKGIENKYFGWIILTGPAQSGMLTRVLTESPVRTQLYSV